MASMPSDSKTGQHADVDVFTAIAHPVRREILNRLVGGALTVTHLAEPFDISRPAISQHLAILLESGLVVRERRGREQLYRLRPENLNAIYRWLKQFEGLWTEKLDALGSYLDSLDSPEESSPDET